MVSSTTAIVGSPPTLGRRRASTRRSSGGLPDALHSPRTPLPRDDNAFSFLPKHLHDWLMPDSVWASLPIHLKIKIKNFQHSGAAVLTSSERLQELAQELPEVIHEDDEIEKLERIPPNAERTAQDLIDASAKLAIVQDQLRASETARHAKEKFDCVRVPFEHRTDFPSFESGITAFSSDLATPCTNVTSCPSPLELAHLQEPVSPLPLDLGQASRRSSSGKSTMTGPPRNAQTGHYLAQLDQLKTEDVVRLRHSVSAVETELLLLSKSLSPTSSPEDTAVDSAQLAASELDAIFLVWWPEKKALARSLENNVRSIEPGLKFKLGWSDVTHLGD